MSIVKLASLELYLNLECGRKQRALNQSEIEARLIFQYLMNSFY